MLLQAPAIAGRRSRRIRSAQSPAGSSPTKPPTPSLSSWFLAAAEAQWQLTRAQNAFDKAQYAIYEEQPDCTLWTEEHHKLYSKFQRYQSAAERSFQRAFHDVERLRRTQLKQEEVAFKRDLDNRRFALRQDKTRHETALIQAKIDLTNAKNRAATCSEP
ncbi:MAG TPA: hypothetical protein VGG97_12230 [Bryobacteraceae bacterium]